MASDNTDPFRVLGIKPGASAADIKAAYRRRAAAVHPDKGGTHEQMRDVNVAYQMLCDGYRPAAPKSYAQSATRSADRKAWDSFVNVTWKV
jgi:curved DNA-binding protein CbpA